MPKVATPKKTTKAAPKKAKEPQRISASLKNLRTSPRKVRLVADLIKGMPAEQALVQLKYRPEKSARPLEKLIASALASAENNAELVRDNLKVETVLVDPGMTIKRYQPRARGSAYRILKRSSHIKVELVEIEAGKKLAKKAAAKPAQPKAAKPAKAVSSKADKDAKAEKKEETTEQTKSAIPGTAPVAKKDQKGGKKGFSKNLFHRRGNM